MIDQSHYVPILKAKAGELAALSKISPKLCAAYTPLVELIPIPPKWLEGKDDPIPSKTIDAHIDAISKAVGDACGTSRPIFVDGYLIEGEDVLEDELEPIAGALNRLQAAGVQAIPVVGIGRYVEYNDACLAFANEHDTDLCVRLSQYELGDSSKLPAQLQSFLNYLHRQAAGIHLVVDYGAINPAIGGALKIAVASQVAAISDLGNWKSLTLSSTAFPSDLTDVAKNSVDTIERTEWDVWKHVRKELAAKKKRVPTFADYTVTHPELAELDPRKIRISPKIKYCDELQWVVAKGEALRRKKEKAPSVPPAVQYPALAQKIMNHAAWKGPNFSFGDAYIAQCAAGQVTGRPQDWVTAGTSHHIVFVVQQLANLPSP